MTICNLPDDQPLETKESEPESALTTCEVGNLQTRVKQLEHAVVQLAKAVQESAEEQGLRMSGALLAAVASAEAAVSSASVADVDVALGTQDVNNGGILKEKKLEESGWHALPSDLLQAVMRHLAKPDLRDIRLVCTHWRDAASAAAAGHQLIIHPHQNPPALSHLAKAFPSLSYLHLYGEGNFQLGLPELSSFTGLRTLLLEGWVDNPVDLRELAGLVPLKQLYLIRCSFWTESGSNTAAAESSVPPDAASAPQGLSAGKQDVILDLEAHVSAGWDGPQPIWDQRPPLPTVSSVWLLEIEHVTMTTLPTNFFHAFPALRWIWISVGFLTGLDQTGLTGLEHVIGLELADCSSLERLPEDLGRLSSLQALQLHGCSSLLELPGSLSCLSTLTCFEFDGCGADDFKADSLERALKDLTNIKELAVTKHCTSFNAMLPSMQQLSRLSVDFGTAFMMGGGLRTRLPPSLKELRLQGVQDCTVLDGVLAGVPQLRVLKLHRFAENALVRHDISPLQQLQHMSHLSWLELTACHYLSSLPLALGELSALQKLTIKECRHIRYLPSTVGQLKNLSTMELSNSAVWWLPNDIADCTALRDLRIVSVLVESLPNKLPPLTSLILHDCHSLKMMPDELPTTLSNLEVSRCRRIRTLPQALGNSCQLRVLKLTSCEQLVGIPRSISNLQGLESLVIMYCTNLCFIPEAISRLTAKMKVELAELGSDERLEEIDNFPRALSLSVGSWVSLKSLPRNLGNVMQGLQILEVKNCKQLKLLSSSLGSLSQLHTLKLGNCGMLDLCPNLMSQLTALRHLSIVQCSTVELTSSLCLALSILKTLTLEAISGKAMPEEFGKMQLTQLALRNLDVESLPATFGNLSLLCSLEIARCNAIEVLPASTGQLTALRSVSLKEMERLRWLPDGLSELHALRLLRVYSCPSLLLSNTIGSMSQLQYSPP